MALKLPKFVKLSGEIVNGGGFRTTDAKLYGFAFLGDKNCLQKVCDEWFNQPGRSHFHFTPISPVVFMVYVDAGCPMGRCQNKEWERGICREINCANTKMIEEDGSVCGNLKFHDLRFFFIVKRDDGRIYTFSPYYFNDNGNVLAFNREQFGFQGVLGSFVSPNDLRKESANEFISCTIPVPYPTIQKTRIDGPGPMRKKIFSLYKQTSWFTADPSPRRENNATTLVARLAETAFSELSAIDLKTVSEHLSFQGSGVSLRQYRAVEDDKMALAQTLIEYKVPLAQTSNSEELTAKFVLDFSVLSREPYRKLNPIYEDLGLKATNNLALFAFKSDCNFEYKPGDVLFNLFA